MDCGADCWSEIDEGWRVKGVDPVFPVGVPTSPRSVALWEEFKVMMVEQLSNCKPRGKGGVILLQADSRPRGGLDGRGTEE